MNNFYRRLALFILVYLLVVTVPWWLSGIVLLGLTVYLSNYVEVIFFGFLLDTLYASRYPMPFSGLSIATVFLISVILIKTRIRT